MSYLTRTDRGAHKSHIHQLVPDYVVIEEDGKDRQYRYRCLDCGYRFSTLTGVLIPHPKAEMVQTWYGYSGRSTRRGGQWMGKYECPSCKRVTRQDLNRLGQHTLHCDGKQITKEAV